MLALAQREFDPATFQPSGDLMALMQDLEISALIGEVDPPRAEAVAAIAKAKHAGIRVRMITGDHAITAAAIADELGIRGRAVTGAEFAAMSDAEADSQVDGIGVIARVAPEHKVRLVEVLKRKGNIVAMTGDGVNDAPAIAAADIGIAMGITGTDVAKGAAKMILADDNFATIVAAVEQGRLVYDNLQKFIRIQVANLFMFILAFIGSSAFAIAGTALLSPAQVLWIHMAIVAPIGAVMGLDLATPGIMDRKPRPFNRADHRPVDDGAAVHRRAVHGGRDAGPRADRQDHLRLPRDRPEHGHRGAGADEHRRRPQPALPRGERLRPVHPLQPEAALGVRLGLRRLHADHPDAGAAGPVRHRARSPASSGWLCLVPAVVLLVLGELFKLILRARRAQLTATSLSTGSPAHPGLRPR